MDIGFRPIDERSVHPDFALRFHDVKTDYSSGPEEASSKGKARDRSGEETVPDL
jgi:hypothetical protein